MFFCPSLKEGKLNQNQIYSANKLTCRISVGLGKDKCELNIKSKASIYLGISTNLFWLYLQFTSLIFKTKFNKIEKNFFHWIMIISFCIIKLFMSMSPFKNYDNKSWTELNYDNE